MNGFGNELPPDLKQPNGAKRTAWALHEDDVRARLDQGAQRDMKNRAVLPEKSITRVAMIGSGLDFTDKGFGYDFHPVQTLQRLRFTIRSFD